MFKKWMRYVLMDQAGDSGAAGTGAPAVVDPAVAAAPAVVADPATVLQAAASTEPKGIPEKFQVKNDDGSINHEATALKLADGYSAAEKRIGSGEAPPKSAEEYKITVPKALEGAWDTANDPQIKSFTEKAHALGFNQKQMDLVIEAYGDLAPGLVEGASSLSAAECTAALKETWSDPAQYKAETDAAARALMAYGGDSAEPFLAKYGNDPDFIKMMAKIGHEVAEDTSIDPGAVLGGKTIQELEASPAYRDPKDPNHAAVSKQVRAYYEAKEKQDAAAGKSVLF